MEWLRAQIRQQQAGDVFLAEESQRCDSWLLLSLCQSITDANRSMTLTSSDDRTFNLVELSRFSKSSGWVIMAQEDGEATGRGAGGGGAHAGRAGEN